jgi:hypothetical protein
MTPLLSPDARYWHKAEVSCFRGIGPLCGMKRTSATNSPVSQNDPKRTLGAKDASCYGAAGNQ